MDTPLQRLRERGLGIVRLKRGRSSHPGCSDDLVQSTKVRRFSRGRCQSVDTVSHRAGKAKLWKTYSKKGRKMASNLDNILDDLNNEFSVPGGARKLDG